MKDEERFQDVLRSRRGLFAPGPVAVGRAPGRLDVMGGIADYCGSLVLELPLREATRVAAQQADDDRLRIVSLPAGGDPARTVEIDRALFDRLAANGYQAACEHLRGTPDAAWAAYVVGVLLVLARERRIVAPRGLRILISSDVPEGKGVSSSAALEVAAMQAVAGLLGHTLDGRQLARLCQLAENRVVGAPCGIMDQMTSALGRQDHLLALLCQPTEVQGFFPLPDAISLWGIDSGIRHAVSGSDYTSVRTGAFMGYRILADLAGLAATPAGPGMVRLDDPRWHGYLANLAPGEFQSHFAPHLPEQLRGEDFLARYGGITDPVTQVDPARVYAVRQPTAHPVYENSRVRRFAELLAHAGDEPALGEMGRLMFDSHASYSACGLGSAGTDRLVDMVRQAGSAAGLFGAKITGGGSGGTVAVLARADAGPALEDLARRYAAEAGRGGYLFHGSSPGACQRGVQWLDLEEK